MIGEVIKEYLVSLGVRIDKPGFNQMKTTLDQTSGVVTSTTSGWAKDFTSSGVIIATALASVTASIVGVMTAAAKQDLAMEKYSRNMLVSKQSALEMKTAMDALGESVQDIQLTPELMERYRALVADGRNMRVGGDYEGTMRGFRDLVFEFTRLKQEASYALQWVGYYLMKYLSRPLADAKESFRSFNDNLIKTMPVWTEKIARALVYIINVGRHFFDLLKAIGKAVYDVWDAFPRGIKIATAALAGFILLLRATPFYRMIALFGTLLLLADDYFGYMEGKQAALGPIWDKLNTYMDVAKQKMSEWGAKLDPVWDSFVGYLILAKNKASDLTQEFVNWLLLTAQSESVKRLRDSINDLADSLFELRKELTEFTIKALNDFFDSFNRRHILERFIDSMSTVASQLNFFTKIVNKFLHLIGQNEELESFVDLFVALLGILVDLLPLILDFFFVGRILKFVGWLARVSKSFGGIGRLLTEITKDIGKLFNSTKNGGGFRGFWAGIVDIMKNLKKVVLDALGSVGKLGAALLLLVTGDYKGAKRMVNSIFSGGNMGWRNGRTEGLSGGEEEAEPYIQKAAKEFNLNPNLLRALIKQESGFQSDIVSSAGAIGYSQLMPKTAEALGVNPWDPYENIWGGAKYLRQQLDSFDGDLSKALAAYNAGPNAVREHDGIPPYAETRNYVASILSLFQDYEGRTIQEAPKDNSPTYPSGDSTFQNAPDDMRDPSWWDRLREWWGNVRIPKPTAFLANGIVNADPMVLNGLLNGVSPAYASYGGSVTNITYQVDVGGVNVTNTNASPDDIGNAVGKKTVSSLDNRANYVLKNRALNGVQQM